MARKSIVTKDNTITSQGTEPLSREVARPIFGENVLAIDYNFAEKKILDDDITFSRASGATQTNSSGNVAFAPHNDLQYSEDLSNNWWQSNSPDVTTVRSTTIKDPFGGYNAHEVTVDSTSNPHIARVNANANPSNRNVVKSIYARTVSGTIDQVSVLGATHASHRVSLTEEWQRFSLLNDTTTSHFYLVDFRNNTSNVVGTKVLLYGAQQEQTFDGNPTDFIKTSGAAYQAPRFDYDKDGNKKGLNIEEGRTNKITSAINLSSGISLGSPAITLASNIVDPSGGNETRKITQHASNVYQSKFAAENIPIVSPGVAWNRSIYCKAAEMTWVKIQHYDSANNAGVYFDLANGQIGTKESGTTATMEDVGNGWYRCSVTYTATNNAPYERLQVALARQDNDNVTYTGDGVSGIYIYGGQLEQGSFPTSLIPTYGASASRAADIASVTGTAFSRFFKDTQGTIVADVQLPRGHDPSYNRLYNFSDNSFSDELQVYLHGTNSKLYGNIITGSSSQGEVISLTSLITTGEVAKIGQTYKTNKHIIYQDGVKGEEDNSVNLPTNFNKLTIGSRFNGSSQLSGWIRRLRYFNKQKSDTQVQKITDTSFLLDKYKGAKAAHSLRSLRDGRDNSPVCSVRRSYDSHEAGYTANQVTNGELENDFKSEAQTTLPLDVSVEAEEMIQTPDFSSGTGWTAGTGWAISGNVATHTGSAGNLSITATLKPNQQYVVTLDVLTLADSTCNVYDTGTGATYGQFTSVGSHSLTFTKVGTGALAFRTGSSNCVIDNASLKEVNPIATGFSTRKINSSYTGKAMRCRNQGNVEVEVGFDDNNEISLSSPVTNSSQNLLAYSEDFGEWGYHSTYTPTLQKGIADPFGGNNAGLLTAAGSNNASQVKNDNLSLTSGTHYTVSLYIKKGTSTKTRLGIYKSGWIFWTETTFDASGVPSSTGNLNSTNISYEKIGDDGWYRFSFVGKATTTASNHSLIFYPDRNATNKNAYIFGAQLEETQYDDGVEKITNGTFDTDSDWSDTSGVSISNGKLNFTITNGGNQFARQSGINYQVGKKYRLTAKIKRTSLTAGGHPGGVIFRDDPLGSGDLNHVVTLDGTEQSVSVDFTQTKFNKDFLFIGYDAGTTFTFEVDDVSLLEISPELQTYAQTPVISNDGSNTTATTLGEFSGLENLFTHSDDMSTGWNWISNAGTITANATTDPTGGTNAIKIVPKAISGNKLFRPSSVPTNVVGDKYCLSIYVKSAGHRYFKFYLNDAESRLLHVDLQEGTIAAINNINGEGSIEALANDWYRVSLSHTVTSSVIGSIYMNSSNASNFPVNFTGDGTSGVFVWGAQFNTNSLKPFQATTSTALTGDVNVVNWYDQAGGEDFVNATAAYQPRIVMGSELVTDSGGKASVYFDGGDNLINATLAGQNRLDSFIVIEPDLVADDSQVLFSANDGAFYGFLFDDGGSSQSINFGFGTTSEFINGTQLASSATRNDAHDRLLGTSVVSLTEGSTTLFNTFQMGWFNSAGSDLNYTGKISEMVFFPNMDSSPKRFPIEQNMLNHFDVYSYSEDFNNNVTGWATVDGGGGTSSSVSLETSAPITGIGSLKMQSTNTGTADTLPRLRISSTGYTWKTGIKYELTFDTKVLSGSPILTQIRPADGGSDNFDLTNVTLTGSQSHKSTKIFTTAPSGGDDIEFHFDGRQGAFQILVDNIKLKEVGTSGYVTTLYDQTGNNNHASQATVARQPQIVSGGDLIKSGNRPAWEHAQTSNMRMDGKIKAAHLDAWFVADTADDKYIYPSNFVGFSDHGFVAQDTSGAASTGADYGSSAKIYANGTDKTSNTRDQLHSSLNGRKLVHHQAADTADWEKLEMGFYGTYTNDPFNYVGKFSEWIWYDSDQSSNRTGIESNINTHYNIY